MEDDFSHKKITRRKAIGGTLAFGAAACTTPDTGMTSMNTSSRDRLAAALARIADPKGEGARACLTVYADTAHKEAEAADARKRAGKTLGPLDGAIVSIKDLFDVAGEPTRAGSKVLANAPPAKSDAMIVKRLRAAGAVIVAKTNMTEFAFSGLGANPHYGTPGNPADRTRIPGGSSSGAGVAVADGFCEIAIGTDTGGSTRIPAAFCGIVGFKPSKQRIPTDGAFPLSQTMDSIGPLAKTVEACALADAILAAEAPWKLEPANLGGLKIGVPQGLPLRDLDETTGTRFSDALGRLTRAGAKLSDETFGQFEDMMKANSGGSIIGIEAYAIHGEMIATRGAEYDPQVRSRIEASARLTAADYARKLAERAALVKSMDQRLAGLDVLVLPTTPIVAPTMTEISTNEGWGMKNGQCLRNTSIVNFFDLCAISVPMPHAGGLHTGLMLVARNGQDRRLFEVAAAVEQMFAG
jgi:aspartyl-tRNA(Asn)/glutamyl-tRNA(Gln) amidotransferase subunit A